MAHNKLSMHFNSLLSLDTFVQENLFLEFGLLKLPHLFHEILQLYILIVESGL